MNKTLITFFTVLFCLTSSVGWSLEMKDLVERDGLFYKKSSSVPFTGKVRGEYQGSIKNGEREGYWIYYWDKEKLRSKGKYKNGYKEGSWVSYNKDGTVRKKYTGTYKDGIKISD